jgi:hypothetical protein
MHKDVNFTFKLSYVSGEFLDMTIFVVKDGKIKEF